MVSGHTKIWAGLMVAAAVLMSVRLFAPLSGVWDKILGGAALAIWLAYIAAYIWEDFRKRQADQSSSAAISSSDQM